MLLSNYQDIWIEDCKIDEEALDQEALKVIKLHSKYMKLLSNERLRLKSLAEARKKIETKLTDYYSGAIDGKDIGREPFQIKLTTQAGIQARIDKDKEIIEHNLKMAHSEECVLFLKEVLNNINQRTWLFKNAIEWRKFTSGIDI